MGFVFVPLNLTAFATLTRICADSSALMNLVRNIGSAIGVSAVLSSSVQIMHAQLSGYASR